MKNSSLRFGNLNLKNYQILLLECLVLQMKALNL